MNGFSKTLTYTYDQVGQRSTMVAPETGSFTYAWNAVGQLASMVSPLGERTTLTNDAAGRRTLQQNANGTRSSYSYDRADQLLQLFHLKSDNSVLQGFSYANDPVGNRTSVLESTGDRVTWSYDRTYQLTNESRSGANAYNTTFVYDPVRNRLVQNATGALTTYAYDVANQLVTHKDSTGTTTYVFDATGNQEVVIAPAGTRTTTTWDYENHPTQFQDQTGILQTAKYTAEQLRAEKVASGTTTKFLWDGPRYVAEFDGTNAAKLLYSGEPPAYGSLYSQSLKSGSLWTPSQFHSDCIGSARTITDSAALVTDTWTFAAFGTSVASSGSTPTALKFCGAHGYLADFGSQYYVRARMYDCLLGRFTGWDPLGFTSGLNVYRYCRSAPLERTDPSGKVSRRFDAAGSEEVPPEPSCPPDRWCREMDATPGCRGLVRKPKPPIYDPKSGRSVLGLTFCDKGSIVIEIYDQPQPGEPNAGKRTNPCIMACVQEHEDHHKFQVSSWCPSICACYKDETFDISYDEMDVRIEMKWECPAYLVALECLIGYTDGTKIPRDTDDGRACDLAEIDEMIEDWEMILKTRCPGYKVSPKP